MGVKPGVHVGLFLPNTPHYLIAFFGVSIYISMRNMDHGNFVPRLNALLLDEAIGAYESHGAQALSAEMERIGRHLSGQRLGRR